MNSFAQKIVIVLIAVVCFCNCATEIEYCYSTDFVVKNDSSHTILVKGNSLWYPTLLDTTVQSNSECRIYSPYIAQTGPDVFIDYSCDVVFDGTLKIVHYAPIAGEIAIEHSICDENSLTRQVKGKHKTYTVFTYTFTDADYDRAVEWNAKYGATLVAQ